MRPQQKNRGGSIVLGQQGRSFYQRGVARKQRIGIARVKPMQHRRGRRRIVAVAVGGGQVVVHVIAQFAGMRLRALQIRDGGGVFVIQSVGIADGQPGKRGRFRIFGMLPRVFLHPRVRPRGARFHELLRHGTKFGRCHEYPLRLAGAQRFQQTPVRPCLLSGLRFGFKGGFGGRAGVRK